MTKNANRKKYHYIYKTTCTVTGKYYIGMHSTDNLEDGYVGSGKRLWYSINKHGKENHVCEILEYLPDRSSLRKREADIVCEEQLTDPLCMNLKLGGHGGFDHVNSNSEIQRAKSIKSNARQKELRETDPYWAAVRFLIQSQAAKKLVSEGRNNPPPIIECHTDETKRKIGEANSKHQLGSGNSQYGTCWVFNELEQRSMKIAKTDLDVYLNQGWKSGRQIKSMQ